MLLFVLSEAVQSELDKLETSFKGESSLIGGFESGYGYYYRRWKIESEKLIIKNDFLKQKLNCFFKPTANIV